MQCAMMSLKLIDKSPTQEHEDMKQSQPEPQKFYHIVKDGRLVQGRFARKANATKTARTIPGAVIVEAAGRAELRQMGIEVGR